jgi:hypothetical protein
MWVVYICHELTLQDLLLMRLQMKAQFGQSRATSSNFRGAQLINIFDID